MVVASESSVCSFVGRSRGVACLVLVVGLPRSDQGALRGRHYPAGPNGTTQTNEISQPWMAISGGIHSIIHHKHTSLFSTRQQRETKRMETMENQTIPLIRLDTPVGKCRAKRHVLTHSRVHVPVPSLQLISKLLDDTLTPHHPIPKVVHHWLFHHTLQLLMLLG